MIGKLLKADILLHVAKAVAAGLALAVAVKGLHAALSDED